jgi:hypothetical protein
VGLSVELVESKVADREGSAVSDICSLAGIDSATVKVTALILEMDTIHFANTLYWHRGGTLTFEGRAAYQRRLDRLETILNELDQLRWVRPLGEESLTLPAKPSLSPIAVS